MIFANFDYTSLQRARKSMITIAVFLLLFAAIELKNDTLKIFGLEVLVNQTNFVKTLQIALLMITLLFILRSLQAFPRAWHKVIFLRDRKWEIRGRQELDKFERETLDPNYDPSPSADYDTAYYQERLARRQRRQVLLELSNTLVAGVGISLDYIIPLFVSFFVLLEPYALANALK